MSRKPGTLYLGRTDMGIPVLYRERMDKKKSIPAKFWRDLNNLPSNYLKYGIFRFNEGMLEGFIDSSKKEQRSSLFSQSEFRVFPFDTILYYFHMVPAYTGPVTEEMPIVNSRTLFGDGHPFEGCFVLNLNKPKARELINIKPYEEWKKRYHERVSMIKLYRNKSIPNLPDEFRGFSYITSFV